MNKHDNLDLFHNKNCSKLRNAKVFIWKSSFPETARQKEN